MASDDTAPPIRLSEARRVAMPAALLVSLLVGAAVAYARLTRSEDRLDQHEASIVGLQTEARQTREILIRIDENVKDLRRAQRRTDP